MIERVSTTIPTPQRTTYDEEAIKIKKKLEEKVQIHNEQVDPLTKDPKKKEKVEEIIKGLNDFLHPAHTSLKFQLHEKLNEYYVSIIDDDTKEVVKEIPSKKLLDTYAAMAEHLGLLVDKKI